MRVGAIVNTINEEMIGYGGVDLAIHAIAGAELDTECAKLAPLDLGQAQITGGSQVRNLHLRTYVVGGLWGEGILLHSCYIESFKHQYRAVTFLLVSSGTIVIPMIKS